MFVVNFIKSTGQSVGTGIVRKIGDVASYLGLSTKPAPEAKPRIPAASEQSEPTQTPVKQRVTSPVKVAVPSVSKAKRRERLIRKYMPDGEAFEDACKLKRLKPGKRFQLNTLAGYQQMVKELVEWHEFDSDSELEAGVKSEMDKFIGSASDFLVRKRTNPKLTSAHFLEEMGYENHSPAPPKPVDNETLKQKIAGLYKQENQSTTTQPQTQSTPTRFFQLEGDYFDGDVLQVEANKLQHTIISKLANTWHPWEKSSLKLPVVKQSRMDRKASSEYSGAQSFSLTLTEPDEASDERISGILKTMPAFYRNENNSLTRFQADMQSYLEMICLFQTGEEVAPLTPEDLKIMEKHEEQLNATLSELDFVGLPVVDEAIEHLRLQKAVMEQFKTLFVLNAPPFHDLG